MKLLFKVKYLLIVLLLGITSCNQHEEIKINDFITVEIKDIIKKKSFTGLELLLEKDSLLLATIQKEQFDNFEKITKGLQINQKVKVKGIIYKHEDERFFKTQKSSSSTILVINEMEY